MEENDQSRNNIPVLSQTPAKEQSSGQQLQESTQKVSSRDTGNLTNKTGSSNKPSSKMALIYLSIISCLILCMIALTLFFPFSSLSRIQNGLKHVLTDNINKGPGPSDNTSTTPAGKPISGIGPATGFTVQVDKIINNPAVSGDKPLNGFTYLVLDVSVKNNTGKTTTVPGMFYFHDAKTGKLFMPADVIGYVQYVWILTAFSNKKVTIPDKTPMLTTEIPSGQTITGNYLIYQIPTGEKGDLVWDTTSIITPMVVGMHSNNSIQLAGENRKLFELNATNSQMGQLVVFSIP